MSQTVNLSASIAPPPAQRDHWEFPDAALAVFVGLRLTREDFANRIPGLTDEERVVIARYPLADLAREAADPDSPIHGAANVFIDALIKAWWPAINRPVRLVEKQHLMTMQPPEGGEQDLTFRQQGAFDVPHYINGDPLNGAKGKHDMPLEPGAWEKRAKDRATFLAKVYPELTFWDPAALAVRAKNNPAMQAVVDTWEHSPERARGKQILAHAFPEVTDDIGPVPGVTPRPAALRNLRPVHIDTMKEAKIRALAVQCKLVDEAAAPEADVNDLRARLRDLATL